MAEAREANPRHEHAGSTSATRTAWQRGSNENTNGLLRQYFPKNLDLNTVTLAQLERSPAS